MYRQAVSQATRKKTKIEEKRTTHRIGYGNWSVYEYVWWIDLDHLWSWERAMHIFDYSTINFRLVAGEYVKEKREKKHTHTFRSCLAHFQLRQYSVKGHALHGHNSKQYCWIIVDLMVFYWIRWSNIIWSFVNVSIDSATTLGCLTFSFQRMPAE